VAVLCDGELLGRSARQVRVRRRPVAEVLRRTMPDFSDLIEGELVVHLEHGIARFEELREIPREGTPEQVLVLGFAHNAKMYVPLEQSGLVSRYVGIGKRNPPLSELGDGKWARARQFCTRISLPAGRALARPDECDNRPLAKPAPDGPVSAYGHENENQPAHRPESPRQRMVQGFASRYLRPVRSP
jgi:transcription-repair coupling factor (superfamily II helicase)